MHTLPKIKIAKKPTIVKFAEDINFFDLFTHIEQQFDTCFIFESLGEEGNFARYSIIGFDPDHTIAANQTNLRFDKRIYEVKNPYEELRRIMPEKTITNDYAGGLIGYLSYEAVNYFEPTLKLKAHRDFDQFLFGVYTDGLIYDKVTNELFYFYYYRDRRRILKAALRQIVKKQPLRVKKLGNTLTRNQHEAIVLNVKEHIAAGNIFQCEVGFQSQYQIEGDTLSIYNALRESSPSPFMYYLKFGKQQIIGASPELLFSLRAGEMTTRPLAGTINRGKTAGEDQRLARELLNDPKEQAEHNMLVDLHRNDIGRVAQFGTVRIKDLMSVKKFSHVQHISSEITGLIRHDEDMFSALASNFPAGTLTGAPKVEAMKIISKNEITPRGPYGGAVGHFGFNGDCTFAIAIRSLFVYGSKGYTQTCGGIVHDSQPKKEYQEVINKLKAVQEVLK